MSKIREDTREYAGKYEQHATVLLSAITTPSRTLIDAYPAANTALPTIGTCHDGQQWQLPSSVQILSYDWLCNVPIHYVRSKSAVRYPRRLIGSIRGQSLQSTGQPRQKHFPMQDRITSPAELFVTCQETSRTHSHELMKSRWSTQTCRDRSQRTAVVGDSMHNVPE